MASGKVAPRAVAADLREILDSPEAARLIAELDGLRWTGRKGYGARMLVGACLAKSFYGFATWTRTVALIREHPGLQDALGGCPSLSSCYRFMVKLRENRPLLEAALDRVAASLRDRMPGMGQNVAIDASDLPAYGNGQRFAYNGGPERERYSDPDASWGHRSAVSTRAAGSFYGFKLHAAVCVQTGLPLAWRVETARRNESLYVAPLLDAICARGFNATTVAMDKGYDNNRVMDETTERGCIPIVSLRKGRPIPLSLIPYGSDEWKRLYRGRAAAERAFALLKTEYGLTPLRVRGLAKVQLHADLTILAHLSLALAQERLVAFAA